MNAKTVEGVLLHHVIVVGGSTLGWSEMADDAWQVRLAELGKVADHVGASWLTLRPFQPAPKSPVVPARELAVGSCWVVANPQADGRERLAEATRQLQAAGATITEGSISAALNAPALADPDLVVIVGNRHRMPPSLVWELAYSELVYVDTNWQHFGPGHLDEAIGSFARRHRRFGGID